MFSKKQKKTQKILVSGLFLILILILLSGCFNQEVAFVEVVQEKQDTWTRDQLGDKLPIAIILDNFEKSYPVSGINSANIVYEVPAEADITRFLTIFNIDSLPDKIGPVRSARPYLAGLAEEYGALFIHAGGSPEALNKISKGDYFIHDLNEISKDGIYFWRDWKRQMPHNLYISKQSIINVIKDKNLPDNISVDFVGWKVKSPTTFETKVVGNKIAEIVKIDYRQNVIWQWDKEKNIYLRYQNGKPFIDEYGEQIRTNNLIIQKTEIIILDEIGRRFIKLNGDGEALIFQQGTLINGRWQRQEADFRTTFYNDQGYEIEFLPGSIWIQIVSGDHRLLY